MRKAGAAVAISILSLNMSGCGQLSVLSDKFSTGQTAKQKPIALTSIVATTHPKLLWKQQLASDKKIKNDKVQLLILENILYGAGGSSLSALDKKTGALLWQEDVGERITGGIKGIKTLFLLVQQKAALLPLMLKQDKHNGLHYCTVQCYLFLTAKTIKSLFAR
jgi:hypothetical protein